MKEFLKGSPLRDNYKFEHKQRYNYKREEDWRDCQAFDLDIVEVRRKKIVAFTDVKRLDEELEWIEKICYQQLEVIAPVLIIETNENFSLFKVYRFQHSIKLTFSKTEFFNNFLPNIEFYIKRL